MLADVDPAVAEEALRRLAESLASVRSRNEEILAALEDVLQIYRDARVQGGGLPWAEFRARAEDAFLRALVLEKILVGRDGREEANLREDVNLRAAEVLGETGNADLSRSVVDALDGTLLSRWHPETPPRVLEAAFVALARLGDPASLEWMGERFVQTNPREVDRIVAAHRAMALFERPPGRLRCALVQELVTVYRYLEALAAEPGEAPDVVAARAFWARVGPGAVRVCRVFAGGPVDARGRPLATMQALAEWYRDHHDPRRDPWLDPPPARDAGGTGTAQPR